MQLRVDDLILQIAGNHDGLCTRRDLLAAGLSSSSIDRRVKRGTFEVVGAGIYLVPPMRTEETDRRRALLLVSGSALSRRTAASLHVGLRLPPPHPASPIEMVAPFSTRGIVAPGIVVHRTYHLPSADLTEITGLAVTTVERTICDLAASLSPRRLQFVAERAILDDLCSLGELAACRSAFVRRGRRGSRVLNAVMDHLQENDTQPDDAPEATEIEKLLRSALSRAGITGFVEQFQPDWYDGRRGVVDVAHPRAKIILEADSRRWHATTQAMADDRRRDRLAEANGWIVLRFTWHELKHRPDAVAQEIAALVAARTSSAT